MTFKMQVSLWGGSFLVFVFLFVIVVPLIKLAGYTNVESILYLILWYEINATLERRYHARREGP